jgi:hypothetical protein
LDLSDQALIDKVRRGDYQSFESLVTRYESKVYRLAIRMLRNPQDAEDALQETFIQVYRGLPGFEGRSAFSTWLFRLATNACLMKIRHRSTEPSKLLPLEDYLPRQEQGEIPQMVDWSDRPEDALLSKESREDDGSPGEIAVNTGPFHPPGHGRVFQRRNRRIAGHVGGRREIGLHRARLALRGMLSDFLKDEGKSGATSQSGGLNHGERRKNDQVFCL